MKRFILPEGSSLRSALGTSPPFPFPTLASLALLLSIALVGCKWTDFDDLSNQTWVRSQDKPSIGSTDYAISITQATTGTSGGTLAVVSTDAPTMSTIAYDPSGTEKVGAAVAKLGQFFIASLGEKPILVNDGMGHVALVEKAIDGGQVAIVAGDPTAPNSQNVAGPPPDSATYGGTKLYFAGTATGPAMPNLFIDDGTNIASCTLVESDGTTALSTAAITADSANDRLWVWSKTGKVFSYPLSTLTGTCAGVTASTAYSPAMAFSPGTGAHISLVTGNGKTWGVFAAHADKATNGVVMVLDLSAAVAADPAAGAMVQPVDGLLSSTVGTFDSMTYVVLGIPSKQVGGVQAGGVEIHAFDPMTGTLDATAMETLNDAQPENGQLFGRDVTTMQFNGKTILVVAASNEVFAYYRTSIYPNDTRNPPPSP